LCIIQDRDNGSTLTCWIPRSQISPLSDVLRVGDRGWLSIPRWLAERNDLPIGPTAVTRTPQLTLTTLTSIYRDLALRWHPDRAGPDGHKIMVGLNAFWERIKDHARQA
ncbi:MAG TPA: J domain-containing protein, partial [Candidatus Binataceae bacterium]|nr:J domain-containing protein [Candidatus Binataceae bacterium]